MPLRVLASFVAFMR